MYEITKKWEQCRLKAYLCPAGKWTIGWGSTFYLDGKPVKEGDEISQPYADKLFFEIMKQLEYELPSELLQKLTSNQVEAVLSLCYNIGTPSFLKSSLYKGILDEDWFSVRKNWDWLYVKDENGNKVYLDGLFKRRAEEYNQFIQDI